METGNSIKGTSQVDLMNLIQKKLPNLYRDFGQNYSDSEATYISERVALICASDLKIRQCDVSIIGKAFDRLVLGSNSTFKISPKMIVSEISAIATEIDNEKRNGFEVSRNAEEAKNKASLKGCFSSPTSMAVLWKIEKRCDGYILEKKDYDKQTGEEITVELITLEELKRCYEEKLNPNQVFREILDRCPKNPKMFKGRLGTSRF